MLFTRIQTLKYEAVITFSFQETFFVIVNKYYGNVEKLKYFGTTADNINCFHEEVQND
jgi:hypothetical protein